MRSILIEACFLAISISTFGQEKKAEEKYVTELRNLARDKTISTAFEEIDRLNHRTIQELIMLNEIPVPPFKEADRGLKYKQMLAGFGK